jgi:NAD-dependent deacetylase
MHDEIQQAKEWLAAALRIAVLTGAGVSKESGVPTFRDAQTGLWARFDPQALASREGFRRDPGLVWRWYAWRSNMVRSVQPNPAHHALATLGRQTHVTIITQNVDGLHQAAGSEHVLEIHGNIRRYKCLDHNHPLEVDNAADFDEPPACPRCGSLARPDVVWFGEMLPDRVWKEAERAIHSCDLMLVVGTSGLVHPAASLPLYAGERGARTIEINPEHTPLTRYLDLHLQGAAGEVLPELVSSGASPEDAAVVTKRTYCSH